MLRALALWVLQRLIGDEAERRGVRRVDGDRVVRAGLWGATDAKPAADDEVTANHGRLCCALRREADGDVPCELVVVDRTRADVYRVRHADCPRFRSCRTH